MWFSLRKDPNQISVGIPVPFLWSCVGQMEFPNRDTVYSGSESLTLTMTIAAKGVTRTKSDAEWFYNFCAMM